MRKSNLGAILWRYLLIWLIFIVFLMGLGWYSHQIILEYEAYKISDEQEISDALQEDEQIAIVFGTAIDPDGIPRSVLQARLDTALELYNEDAINTILVSGYNDTVNNDYNEPLAMERYLRRNGISQSDILRDDKGDNTFLSCRQAADEFDVNEAVLITQDSHINRAIFLCRHHGIEAYGYAAPEIESRRIQGFQAIRESAANIKALVETTVR